MLSNQYRFHLFPVTSLRSGHHSIVNTALIHPTWPCVLTSGVERHIILHSPTPNSPCAVDMSKTPKEVRALPTEDSPEDRLRVIRALTEGPRFVEPGEDADEMTEVQTIALFDE
jgi:DDB1- and CUL4-associated factor 5